MPEERVIFFEETEPGQHCKLLVSVDVMDWNMIDALAAFLERQRKRLNSHPPKPEPDQ